MDGQDPSQDLWRVALDLNRAAAAVDPRAAHLPPLLFMTDPDRTPDPWRVAGRLPAGAAVIHRAFGRADGPRDALRLRDATAGRGVRLLIAGDPDLAAAVSADGVHLPERHLGLAPSLRARRPDWLLTGSAHAPAPATPAGLDAVLVSPVFPHGGASPARPPLGLDGLAGMILSIGLPAYALGGVDAGRARGLAGSGVCGIAAVGAVTSAYRD